MSGLYEVGKYARCGTFGTAADQQECGANRLDDLLTFMSNAILKSSKDIFGMQKP